MSLDLFSWLWRCSGRGRVSSPPRPVRIFSGYSRSAGTSSLDTGALPPLTALPVLSEKFFSHFCAFSPSITRANVFFTLFRLSPPFSSSSSTRKCWCGRVLVSLYTSSISSRAFIIRRAGPYSIFIHRFTSLISNVFRFSLSSISCLQPSASCLRGH